jgi:diguanylate cyclase (GGDEF)-like protein/PAS domain S-box-containing protein
MTDRTELLEAALDSLPDGIVLFGSEGNIVFWNQAAEEITGYTGIELLTHEIPEELKPLLRNVTLCTGPLLGLAPQSKHGSLVSARHKLGHDVRMISRTTVLVDRLGEAVGIAALFHPAESLDALPHGDTSESEDVGASQTDLEERLRIEFEDSQRGGPPIGVLWIGIDQAPELRKTHGVSACQAMVAKVHRTLTQGLRPAEELGRWGDDEFLIIAHERTPEMLSAHARTLAGMARTADFRWWGDRVSLTVSIGASQVRREPGETLPRLLERAKAAMETSMHQGGNRITSAPGSLPEKCALGLVAVEQAPEERNDPGNRDPENAAGRQA